MTEWRTIPSYPEYEASDEGQIRRRVHRYRSEPGTPLSLYHHKTGYLRAHVSTGAGMKYPWTQRLVCEAFHGPAPSPECDAAHLNGIRHDNRPNNLEWATRRENHRHQKLHGTKLVGERHPNSKLSTAAVAQIRAMAGTVTQREIGERFGVHEETVGKIIRRERYRGPSAADVKRAAKLYAPDPEALP